MIAKELADVLLEYLLGRKDLAACNEWLVGVVWDGPSLDRNTRSLLGRLELLATEASEGLRPESEFAEAATQAVAQVLGDSALRQIRASRA
ncbi:MAG: hypothetical protein HY681_01900 [Chloroflexi bacterium]|nr:hypothetical protein [Chloroflexota bacterium]